MGFDRVTLKGWLHKSQKNIFTGKRVSQEGKAKRKEGEIEWRERLVEESKR